MAILSIPLKNLMINHANDRHGELESEAAAIAWLFQTRETHMRNLVKDIVEKGEIYEMPLVSPQGNKFIVFDGNRRVTCLKLLDAPHRAPTLELQSFFRALRSKWIGTFPDKITCHVESDRDKIDEILYRRHTGSQNGIGQSTWDDRMKATFVNRTGKAAGINVADEIEKRLKSASLLPKKKIPRSTMNRLLSSEPFRNRLGFSMNKGHFKFTHNEEIVLGALARVANDLANRDLVLGDIWDVDGKRHYLDGLENEDVLPTAKHALTNGSRKIEQKPKRAKPSSSARPTARKTLIPQKDFGIIWPGRQQRHHQIWEELQFHLHLDKHINAISVLFRVILELAIENYITQKGVVVHQNDDLKNRTLKVGNNLFSESLIDKKQLELIKKFQNSDQLLSADTLNRYVHSQSFTPSPQHLTSLWDSLSDFIVICLKA